TLPRSRRAVGAHRLRSVPLVLAPLQVLRVRGERRERAFGRGAAEELPAALQLGLELLLRLGEALQRLPRGLGIEFRERLLQLPQTLLQLGRHGAGEQLLHLAEPRLERRVLDPRSLRGAGDLLNRLREFLHALLERLLLAGDRFRALARLERQRATLGPRPRPRSRRLAARGAGVTRALLRQVARPLPQLPRRPGDRVHRGSQIACGGARRRPQLPETRQPQRELRASPDVRGGRVVPGLRAQPQRVARQQPPALRVELPLHDGAVAHAAYVEPVAPRLADLARLTHTPAHHLEPGQPVVVAHVDHERLAE